MPKFLDFEEIKTRFSLFAVAEMLNLALTKKGNQLRGACPACEGSNDRALVVTDGRGAYCFHAKEGGDQIWLASHIKGVPPREAAEWLSGDIPERTKEKKPEKKPEASEVKGFKELDYLQSDHEAVIAVGFDPEDARRLGVGYCPRGVLRGTVAIPVRMSDGTLVGYIGVTEATLPASWRF